MKCGDSIRVVHPLFQTESDGSIPISPLQFNIGRIDKKTARNLNEEWHSRLPSIRNWQNCDCFGAEYENYFYAIAMWSIPSSATLNDRGWLELRRMAIHDDAPKNTASRMLSVMRKIIKSDYPRVSKLISYQDTAVHNGTIYKAAGWYEGYKTSRTQYWTGRRGREGRIDQATTPKIRWEYDLKRKPLRERE